MTHGGWRVDEPLLTARLRLRGHEPEDVGDLLAFHSDPEVVRYLPWPVRDRSAVEETLRDKLGRHRVERDGEWLVLAVEQLENSRVVGEVLLRRGDEVSELGFAFSREVWGRGFASEACSAMLGLARLWGVAVVLAVVVPENRRSATLLTRLGFMRNGTEERRGAVLERYRLTLDEEGRGPEPAAPSVAVG